MDSITLLLPKKEMVSNQKEMSRAINFGVLLTQLAIDALRDFEQGALRRFDALGGDTACQIRAVFVTKQYEAMIKSKQVKQSIQCAITSAQTANRRFRELILNMPAITLPMPLSALLLRLAPVDKNSTSQDAITLILAHTLCRTRGLSNPSKTDGRNLNQVIGDGVSLIEQDDLIVRKAKDELAERSIAFLKKEVAALSLSKADCTLYKSIFTKGLLRDGNRLCSPCYFNIRLLLQSLLADRRIVILKIIRPSTRRPGCERRTMLAYRRTKNSQNFKRLCKTRTLSDQSAVVFEATSESQLPFKAFVKKLRIHGVETLCLTNAAAHPQYVGKNKNAEIPHYSKERPREKISMRTILDRVSAGVDKGQDLETAYHQTVGKCAKSVASLCSPIEPLALCKTYLQQQAHKNLANKVHPLFKIQHIVASTAHREFRKEKKRSV